MAEAASISYGNEFSSEPRKSPLNKHIPASSKVRKTPHGLQILAVRMTDAQYIRMEGKSSYILSRSLS
jgi:hypothetical protein